MVSATSTALPPIRNGTYISNIAADIVLPSARAEHSSSSRDRGEEGATWESQQMTGENPEKIRKTAVLKFFWTCAYKPKTSVLCDAGVEELRRLRYSNNKCCGGAGTACV